MNEEFLSYEIALKLKELGFNEPCFTYYYNINGNIRTDLSINIHNAWTYAGTKKLGTTLAPLYQQVFRWFREQFNWQSSIEATKDQHNHELGYNYWIWNNKTGEEHHTMPKNRPSGDWEFEKYEDAEIACLIKLIEIVKNETKCIIKQQLHI
jgi:hypothetical protein